MTTGFRLLFILTVLSLLGLHVFPQVKTVPAKKEDDDEVIRVETQLVDVPILVTDKLGKPILNLKQNNFVIYEDGAQQDVNDFSTTAAPFEVALLLDTSGSTRNDLALIQSAAVNFISSLRAGDRVAVVSFDMVARDGNLKATSAVLTPLTGDRKMLQQTISLMRTSFGTPYYDGLKQVVDEVFHDPPKEDFRGRRALVALTDGVDSTSLSEFEEVRQKFDQSGIVAYFIDVDTRDFFEQGLLGECDVVTTKFSVSQIRRYYRMFEKNSRVEQVFDFCKLGDFERLAISKSLYERADEEMKSLAKVSGGKVFPVADVADARKAFGNVAQEIGTKYSLAYYSSNEKRDGTFRKIRVELKGAPVGAQIRAREGYLAPKN
jgi:Ca-activated chloride channel family protein